jgi:hypothetical protein
LAARSFWHRPAMSSTSRPGSARFATASASRSQAIVCAGDLARRRDQRFTRNDAVHEPDRRPPRAPSITRR